MMVTIKDDMMKCVYCGVNWDYDIDSDLYSLVFICIKCARGMIDDLKEGM